MNELTDKIRVEIARRGVIPFADFMRLALYCPVYGYYEREEHIIGTQGDYYTSASTGPLFGQLLAFQFCAWFQELEQAAEPRQLTLVEGGAHDGVLARDILAWIKSHRPALFERLQYCIIEPSPRRRVWQKATLADFSSSVRWAESTLGCPSVPPADTSETALPLRVPEIATRIRTIPPGSAIVFSNELLDVMPVHRVAWDAQDHVWFEWGVGIGSNGFVWNRMPLNYELKTGLSISQRFQLSEELLAVLPDGFTIEICPEAERWWHEAAGLLNNSGKLLTIDYGLEAHEFLVPHRQSGTLRAYYRHHLNDDLLARPGEQDITAHVNFSALEAIGAQCGLATGFFGTQPQFLTQLLSRVRADPSNPVLWDAHATRQFQTLTHPDHLGRAFRVLVQGKNGITASS